MVRRERGKPAPYPRWWGLQGQVGRECDTGPTRVCRGGDAEQRVGWGGRCWHLAGGVTGDDILVITGAFPQQLLVGKLEGFNGFLQRLLCLLGKKHLG